MIQNLIRFALAHRGITIAASLGVLLMGAFAWTTLQIVAYPDVADTEVAVIVKFTGRPAEEVEQQITIPLERALNSVPRVIARRSRTIFGLAIVRLTFQEGTDDYFARQQVNEKIKDADIPASAEISLAQLSPQVGEIIRYVIEYDENRPVALLRELQDWVITPKIMQAEGIADVVNFGGVERQFQIIMRPTDLERFALTIQQVSDAIQNNNESTGGNVMRSGASQLAIRSVGRITSKEDIERFVVANQKCTPIFVRDVASVEIGALSPSGVLGYTDNARSLDNDNSIEGIILMRRGENPSEVIASVKEKIDELNTKKLPKGVRITLMYDRTNLVNSTLETVSKTLFEGVSIVMIVLVFFLGNIRAAISVALTIPLSLLFAFIMMKLTNIPANLLSLGAIDFGIIVDAAVVMVEAIMRHVAHAQEHQHSDDGGGGYNARKVIFTAASEVQRQIFFAVIIIILAYMPLFTLQRVEGKLFSPMAYTLSFAIGGSLLLGLTIVPVMCSFFFAKKFSEWHNPIVAWMERHYRTAIVHSLAYPMIALMIGLGAVGASVVVMTTSIGTEFLPELDEGGFNIRCVLPAGVALSSAREYPAQIRKEICSFPEVKFAISQLGRNDDGTDPFGPNRIETLVQLIPYSEWKSGRVKKDLLREIKRKLEQTMPGATFSFSQPILDNVTEAVTGSAADLAILLNGDDITQLRHIGDSVLNIIKPIRGASESGIEQEGPQTQLLIEINRESAARYGINMRDIDNVIELAIAGKAISQVYESERRFDIILRYTLEDRATPEALSNLLIQTTTGMKIPLSQVADVRMAQGQTIIAREDGHRQISVRTNIRERDQGSYVAEAQQKVSASIRVPEGVHIEWGGQFENLTRAKNRLVVVIPITLLLIFFVLFILFDNDAKYAGIVMTNVPFALVGGVGALWWRGMNFSVSAGVGFISLFGVAVMSGVLLISYMNFIRQEERIDLRSAIVKGAVTQFRPVVMMMTVALIGLIPAARATGIGSDVQRPLATVIVGGLVSSLILTLFVMPALYYVIERRAERKTQR